MPKMYKRRGKYKARSSIKKTRGTRAVRPRSVARIPRALTPFPQAKIVRHKYSDRIVLPAGPQAGTGTYYQWRANSVYDPDYSGVGHQPMFHDEMAAQYKHYTVLSSRIFISVPPEMTTASDWSIWCDDDVTIPTSISDLHETHAVKGGIKLDKRNTPFMLSCWYDAAKWSKTTRKALQGDEAQKVDVGTNPSTANTRFYTVYCAPTSATGAITAMPCNVVMYFVVLWRSPKDHAGS